MYVCFLIILRPPRTTRTYTRFPYTTLFPSQRVPRGHAAHPEFGGQFLFGAEVIAGLQLAVEQGGANPLHDLARDRGVVRAPRSEEHTSELQSLMRISYAVFCLKTNIKNKTHARF